MIFEKSDVTNQVLTLYAFKQVSIDTLRRKIVLLFITEFDISEEEILLIGQMYAEAKENQYQAESNFEVVWLPIWLTGQFHGMQKSNNNLKIHRTQCCGHLCIIRL